MLMPWFQSHGISDLKPFEPWLNTMRLRTVGTGEHLVQQGDSDNHLYFVSEGLLRLYYTTPDGKERNKAFYAEGAMLGAVSAAIKQRPASFAIQALEDCRLVEAGFSSLFASAHQHPVTARALIDLLAGAFIRNESREAMLLTLSAEDRYQWLVEHESQLLGRVPQFHLASYIGIDAVSLSRLKRRLKQE
jgi:CRP-like cAMP-binding protein